MSSKKSKGSGGRVSYSNQKNSAVQTGNHVDVGEMVTMEHGGTSGGLDNDGQRTDYLRVAWLLREKLNDLVDGDKGEFPEVGLRKVLDMVASSNIVSLDPKMLNPVLWRTLPKELLHLVFAHLSVPDIFRLRSLSREWKRDIATVNSDINQACDEASPSMVALLSLQDTDFSVVILVTIYDIAKCRWQNAYQLHLRSHLDKWSESWNRVWTPVDACDGGLVCFISLWRPTKRNRLSIVVVNLLTRVQHKLPPPHYLYSALPAMVQIKVNSDTKCYQVVVVGYKRGGLTSENYDSGTRQWTRAAPPCGSIIGPVHNWSTGAMNYWRRKLSSTPGAYDFVEGKLEVYSEINPSTRESVIDSVLEKDRMFVLQVQTKVSHRRRVHQHFRITEYHVENGTKDWVQGKSHECPTFQELVMEEENAIRLYACDGFLMLIVDCGGRSPHIWLLDLFTCEWSNLPEAPEDLCMPVSLVCRAFWNAVP